MKRLATLLFGATFLAAALAAPSQAADPGYGIKTFGLSLSEDQAAAHADFTVDISQNLDEAGTPFTTTRSLEFQTPPGIAGNVAAFPRCAARQLAESAVLTTLTVKKDACPIDSQIGFTEVTITGGGVAVLYEPVYNMVPPPGAAARFGFVAGVVPTFVDVRLDSERDYGLTSSLEGLSGVRQLAAAKTTFWGDPTDASHDTLRITPYEAWYCNGSPCTAPGEEPRQSNLLPTPFMSSPTSCAAPGIGTAIATSYAEPNNPSVATASMPQQTGCGLLEFKPQMAVKPTATEAETSSGLDVTLTFPQEGLEHPHLLAESHLKRAEVTLPEGVTVNPSQAEGLGVCSAADFARETATSAPNVGCPETAKIGNTTAKSPLIDEVAAGGLYIAKPFDNPFDSLLAIYMVLKIPERGVLVKLAGKVEPDPETGQLVTTFDDLPQLPVSEFQLHFREGARSPLVTPPRCGTFQTTSKFTPWSDPSQVTTTLSSFEITKGVNGGPCPSGGTPPFKPGFTAGSLNNDAGAHSPFYMRLTRRDGDQDMTRFSATLPPGVLAKLAGVSQCPDAAIAAAKAKSGKQELASPSCPANSQIGSVLAGAGVGSVLTYVPGKVYLSGPMGKAPLSVVAVVPAVAGPFDVGTVVTREALTLNPKTGVVNVDGGLSDPIPHILAGIPLKVRDIRVYVDRPDFTINPTSCDPFQVGAELWGGGIDVFSTADDSPVSLSSRYQAANCANLGFKPRLSLKLTGGTKRGGHPGLKAIFRPRPGDANLASTVVRLPRSAFLDQAHIRTICTRVQFAAKSCPAGSIYGHVRAFSPLLDTPLEGPAYLRSSDNLLPDLVFDLHGLVDIEASARIDSIKGGIRASFEEIPDAPISKVIVAMQGGKKGLIVNSRDLCAKPSKATVELRAQNGKELTLRPQMKPDCAGKRKSKSHQTKQS